jgi:single-strand DNA-binding protein
MSGLLKITAIGHIGATPTVSTMPSGDTVVNFSLAVAENHKDLPEWFKCHAYGDIADIISDLCQKGTQVYVEAGYKSTKWVDRKNTHHSSFELRIQKITVLNKGKPKSNNTQTKSNNDTAASEEKISQAQRQIESVNATGGFVG